MYLGSRIGYVEDSPFIAITKTVTYPSWQMSSSIGVVHASVLLAVKGKIAPSANLDYFLSSIAKMLIPLGLYCYSEPKLLQTIDGKATASQASKYTLFKFVKQHYKREWLFLLLVNYAVHERKFPIVPFLYAMGFSGLRKIGFSMQAVTMHPSKRFVDEGTLDVIIPTMGREKYLYDFLCDLREQSRLPKNVIIIEQNPLHESQSTLPYLTTEIWPFNIRHTFTHRTGACNARNLALAQTESEWLFLADDDIRIGKDFLRDALHNLDKYATNAAVISCLSEGQENLFPDVAQTTIFGTACSIVKRESIANLRFNPKMEFGYGEDTMFGLELRANGIDVVYFPHPQILHLKAPVGGFRTKFVHPWEEEEIQPKPAPTIMLLLQSHYTALQVKGYMTTLFVKMYLKKPFRNPIKFIRSFRKAWEQSVYWSTKL